jgi:hypothetical protein
MAIVSKATKMTGARDVIVVAELGFASSHFRRGGRKPPILDKEVREQKSPTGKICRQSHSIKGGRTHARVKAQTPRKVTQRLINSDLYTLRPNLGQRRSVQSGAGRVWHANDLFG